MARSLISAAADAKMRLPMAARAEKHRRISKLEYRILEPETAAS
jgi:hypothetical protein